MTQRTGARLGRALQNERGSKGKVEPEKMYDSPVAEGRIPYGYAIQRDTGIQAVITRLAHTRSPPLDAEHKAAASDAAREQQCIEKTRAGRSHEIAAQRPEDIGHRVRVDAAIRGGGPVHARGEVEGVRIGGY